MSATDPSNPVRSDQVVLVQDALPFLGGAEQVLEATLALFPTAPIYTLTHNPEPFKGTVFEGREIHVSWVDRLPGAQVHYRRYLPLFPWTIERFDLSRFDLILSFSYAVAHGVLPRPDQLHLSYTYTPLRYAWQHYHDMQRSLGKLPSWLASLLLHYLRLWDLAAAARVDHFVAISKWVADCIWRAYRRPAEVIYPPVDVTRFQPLSPRGDYYVTVTRLAPHKKVSLIIDAFSRLGYPLYVVGEGEQTDQLRQSAGSNVTLMGRLSQTDLGELLGKARAFVHVAEEDFGIAPVEAQAAGCPVIAFGRGGVRETVIPGETGILFSDQSVDGLMTAVQTFVESGRHFDVGAIRRNAERFGVERFQNQFSQMVARQWSSFQRGEFRRQEWQERGRG